MIHFDPETSREEVLLQLLARERSYYTTVLDIAREENSHLEADRPLAELQPLLRQKRVTLLCIQSIDQTLSPLKRYWQEKKDRSDPLSAKIQEELTALNELLGSILEVDLSSQGHAARHLGELQRRFDSEGGGAP